MITTIDCTWLELIDMLPKLSDGSIITIHEAGVNESTWIVQNGALERLAVTEW